MNETFKDYIKKVDLVEWKKLKPFQPDDFKKITKDQLNKLKTSLLRNGLKSPFLVWQDGKTLWCLDGHTRIPVLKLLEDEGVDVPEKLSAVFVDCKTKQDAKKAILIYNSHYASIQQEPLFDFIQDLNFDEVRCEIDIPNVYLDAHFEFKNTEKEISGDLDTNVECPKCGYKW